MAPSRSSRGRSPVRSTMLEAGPSGAGPASKNTPTWSPSWETTAGTSRGVGWPERLALDTARGPVRWMRARAKLCLGMRTATVPRESPRSQPIPGASRRTRVSGPGHQAAISAWAWSVTSSTRPMAWRQVWTSTGRGRSRPRRLARNRASTAEWLKGSQPSPYTVSVGSTTSPPLAMISLPTSSSPGHCSSSLDTGMTRGSSAPACSSVTGGSPRGCGRGRPGRGARPPRPARPRSAGPRRSRPGPRRSRRAGRRRGPASGRPWRPGGAARPGRRGRRRGPGVARGRGRRWAGWRWPRSAHRARWRRARRPARPGRPAEARPGRRPAARPRTGRRSAWPKPAPPGPARWPGPWPPGPRRPGSRRSPPTRCTRRPRPVSPGHPLGVPRTPPDPPGHPPGVPRTPPDPPGHPPGVPRTPPDPPGHPPGVPRTPPDPPGHPPGVPRTPPPARAWSAGGSRPGRPGPRSRAGARTPPGPRPDAAARTAPTRSRTGAAPRPPAGPPWRAGSPRRRLPPAASRPRPGPRRSRPRPARGSPSRPARGDQRPGRRGPGNPGGVPRRIGRWSRRGLGGGQGALGVPGGQLVDDPVQAAALQHPGQVAHGQADAVVGDPVLGEVVGPDALGAVQRADLRAPLGGQLGLLLGDGPVQQPGPQHPHGLLAVLDLGLLVLHGHDDARGQVGDAHRRVGGVDRLATGAGGAVDVDLEVVRVDGDLDRVGLWEDVDPGGRGVDAALGLGHRDPLHPVHPGLVLEPRPGAPALDGEHGLLDALQVGGALGQLLDLEAVLLGPAGVHAVEVTGEQGGLVAAGAGPDLDDHVLVVVGVLGDQGPAEPFLQGGLAGLGVGDLLLQQHPPVGRALLALQLAGGGQVLSGRPPGPVGADHLAQLGVAPRQLDQPRLVGDDLGIGELALDLVVGPLDLVEPFEHGQPPLGRSSGAGSAGRGRPGRGPARSSPWAPTPATSGEGNGPTVARSAGGRTCSSERMATSIMSGLGGLVVSICSHRPGFISALTRAERSRPAPRRMPS